MADTAGPVRPAGKPEKVPAAIRPGDTDDFLEGPRLDGLPCDAEGFIPIDEHCRVPGAPDVYAVGDASDFALKQGGVAAQQADVAAEAIAAGLGALLRPQTFEPLLRGMLLTGVAPMYMRSSAGLRRGTGEVAANALWWPPTKVAGRYLGPYLSGSSRLGSARSLEDRPARRARRRASSRSCSSTPTSARETRTRRWAGST